MRRFAPRIPRDSSSRGTATESFLSNPDPETGFYLHPADVRLHAVKVFVPGLTRTDLAFVERVVACVRDVREYEASMRRMSALEDARDRSHDHFEGADALPPLRHATPYLEWWRDNYALVVDAMTKRYPLHTVTLHRLVTETESTVNAALAFVGTGDSVAAIASVKPSLRTFDSASVAPPHGLDPSLLPAFDLLFEVLDQGPPDDDSWIEVLGEAHLALAARVDEDLGAVAENRAARRAVFERRGIPSDSEP